MVHEAQTGLDGQQLTILVEGGYHWLDQHSLAINALNIFSYPDYDTGTNLSLTTSSAWQEMSNITETSVDALMGAFAQGALMGARGNGGVILSQVFRGIARETQGEEVLDPASFAEAIRSGSQVAYKGVIRPVEGTILTVARKTAESLLANPQSDWRESFLTMSRVARETAIETPAMLPILDAYGVIDAGGLGLSILLEGITRSYVGKSTIVSKLGERSFHQVIGLPIGNDPMRTLLTLDEGLLHLTSSGEALIPVVKSFIMMCSEISDRVSDVDDRRWLRSTISFWASWVDAQTNTFFFADLLPTSVSSKSHSSVPQGLNALFGTMLHRLEDDPSLRIGQWERLDRFGNWRITVKLPEQKEFIEVDFQLNYEEDRILVDSKLLSTTFIGRLADVQKRTFAEGLLNLNSKLTSGRFSVSSEGNVMYAGSVELGHIDDEAVKVVLKEIVDAYGVLVALYQEAMEVGSDVQSSF